MFIQTCTSCLFLFLSTTSCLLLFHNLTTVPKPQENFVEKKNVNNLNCCEQNEFHNSAMPKAQHSLHITSNGFLNNSELVVYFNSSEFSNASNLEAS